MKTLLADARKLEARRDKEVARAHEDVLVFRSKATVLRGIVGKS